ncbi:OsmC family protein [Loigolactobacillus iwatensis]|uniref:OsmC family protein n=1 Tax=Loigolactobacillus iwatensis TaxID=1267156 RepID=UPI000F7F6880|nr:OsmC family protein [Loigolactobacillus iwatensis]
MSDRIDEANFYNVSYRGITGEHDEVKVLTDKFEVTVNKGMSFDIESNEITSVDHFASALISDLMLAFKNYAKYRSIDIDNLEGLAKFKIAAPLSLLMVEGYTQEPNIASIEITLYLYLDVATHEEFLSFCQKAVSYSLIFNLLKRTDRILISFKQVF